MNLLGVVFFLIYIPTALCVLGARATRAQQHENWAMWIEKTKTIQFPDFNMRTALDGKRSFISCTGWFHFPLITVSRSPQPVQLLLLQIQRSSPCPSKFKQMSI